MAAMAVNCLSSEFGTVLLSHGGWLALSLTALWTLSGRGGDWSDRSPWER
jgi:hypothetical protein